MTFFLHHARLAMRGTALLAALALYPSGSCTNKNSDPPERPRIPVLSAKAESRDISLELREIGTVEAINSVSITSRVSGLLKQAAFQEGQNVKKGDLLFRIDPAPYEAALNQAIENFKHDSISMVNAVRNAERYKDLAAKEFVTKQDFESIVATAAEARASVEANRALLENARLNLDYCTIRAPLSGRTGDLLVTPGNLIVANNPAPLVTINQISPIYARFALPEATLGDVRRRAQSDTLRVWVAFTDCSPKILDGKLTFIDNAIDQATGTIQIKATFPNENRALWPGQFVNVGLVLGKKAGAIVVPASAIQTSQQGNFLYVIMTGDTVQLRHIETGTTVDSMAEIAHGVLPGESVVIDGMMQLRQGSKVSVKSGLVPIAAAGGTGRR